MIEDYEGTKKELFLTIRAPHQQHIAGSHSEGRGAAAPYGIVMYA